MDRRQRLAKLLALQQRLAAVHEARRVGFSKDAASAEAIAESLMRRSQAPDSLSTLFPDLYHERIVKALDRRNDSMERAAREAAMRTAAKARADAFERSYRQVTKKQERSAEEKAALEMIERALHKDGGS